MKNMKMNDATKASIMTTFGGTREAVQDGVDEAPVSDVVKEPPHYKHGTFEVIDEMLIVFGPQRTFDFCIINAWKYRARAPFKDKMEEDMNKSHRYLEMAKQIADAYTGEGYNFPMPKIHLIKGE